MRTRLVSLVLAFALAALSAPGFAAAASHKKPKKKKGPTAAQKLAAAIRTAEHSPDLWATVNVCTSDPSGDTVGIRGQMPSLGIPATLSMSISVSYWNYNTNMFQPSSATSKISLGKGTHGLHQGGVNFPFAPPTPGTNYLVRGTIAFAWTIGSKVVAQVTKNTGHGYANVNFSNPPGLSEGTCTLT